MKYRVLAWEGPRVADFLQGQLTSDVLRLPERVLSYSACCNRQGRVVATFFLLRSSGHYYAFLPSDMFSILHDHLLRYAQVTGVVMQENTGAWLSSDGITPAADVPASLQEQLGAIAGGADALIERQQAMVLPATSTQFLPQALALADQGALSFDKGCYLGQEIVARVQYKGRVKQKLVQLAVDATTSMPQPGDDLSQWLPDKSGTVLMVGSSGGAGLPSAFLKLLAVVPV